MVTVVNLRKERADVPVCRPTVWGNPVHTDQDTGRDEAVIKFAIYFYSVHGRQLRQRALEEIGPGAKIGCYCAPKRCHADIIAGYLNWKRDLSFVWMDTTL